MGFNRPFFSIVIPTRNRASLLRYALRSALEQTFDDYEVVVSDNCSSDDTMQVIKELRTSKVRNVRTDRPLSMPDHWEFALDQARGKYITYLCDDDAWCPEVLRRVAYTIAQYTSNLITLGSAIYYGDNWLDVTHRNCMVVSTYTGRTQECSSLDTLTYLFMCRDIYDAPRMLNSFCSRDSISQVRQKYGRIFLLCPDYSFPAFILTAVPKWIYIDEPLRLQGVFAEGIGSTTMYNRGGPAQEFLREFEHTNLLERVPIKIPLTTSLIAETLLMAKERLGPKLASFEINWEQYFIGCWRNILIHEKAGVKVEADKVEFFRILAHQSEEFQSRVRTAINDHFWGRLLRDPVRRIINSSSILKQLTFLVRGPGARSVLIRGEEAGFSNILECARRLQALLPIR